MISPFFLITEQVFKSHEMTLLRFGANIWNLQLASSLFPKTIF